MKKYYKSAIFALTYTIISSLNACPTCIGRLEGNTPPLFTKEYDDSFWPDLLADDTNESQEEVQNKTQTTKKVVS